MRPSARRRAAAAAGLALAGLAVLTSPPAGAATAPAVAPTVSPVVPNVPVMVVLDASGSMNESDAPGPRIDAAKKAVKSLVAGLPGQTQVGLTVYGTRTGSTAADKAKGCTDITTLVPVATLDAARISGAVDAVKASGYTPIGNALRAAAKALPAEGPRSIVLVSDGEDTCAPPAPCDVAKELERQGVDLTIHTVGFKVDATARGQLACVADATGGTYADAADADQLTKALQVKVDHAITGYTAKGTRITGADQPSEQAPLMNPGQYLDTYARGGASGASRGTTKYYTVPLQEGATLHVAATLVPPTERPTRLGSFGVTVSLLATDGSTCDSAEGNYASNDGYSHRPVDAVMVTTLVHGAAPDRYPDRCPVDGVGIVEVARTGDTFADLSRPVELVVRSEPAADASGIGPAFDTPLPGLPRPTFAATATPLTGGSSFNDAPELTSGQTYTGTIVTGEDRYVKVPLAWGQRLAYAVEEVGPATPTMTHGAGARVNVYNPVRQAVRTTNQYQTVLWFGDGPERLLTGSTAVPVRYTNRTSTSQSKTSQIDGAHYLRLSANYPGRGLPSSRTTYRITVVVEGSPETGPAYQLGAASTPSSTPTTPATIPGATSSTPSDGSSIVAGEASEQEGSSAGLVIGLVAFVALLAAAGAVFVLRGKRAQPPAGPQT